MPFLKKEPSVSYNENSHNKRKEKVFIYARVSTKKQSDAGNLGRQAGNLGYSIAEMKAPVFTNNYLAMCR